MDVFSPIEHERNLRRLKKLSRPIVAARVVMSLLAVVFLLAAIDFYNMELAKNLIILFLVFSFVYLGALLLSFRRALPACLVAFGLTLYVIVKPFHRISDTSEIVELSATLACLAIIGLATFSAWKYERLLAVVKANSNNEELGENKR